MSVLVSALEPSRWALGYRRDTYRSENLPGRAREKNATAL